MSSPSASGQRLPALSLISVPRKRQAILELAAEADARGYAGIACPSVGGSMAFAVSLATSTSSIPFFTAIQPTFLSVARELGPTASHIHELSGGRFRLGLGVSHAPMVVRFGDDPELSIVHHPLAEMRQYVEALRAGTGFSGELPPIWLAALRDKMLNVAIDVAAGALWANAARSNLPKQVARLGGRRPDSFPLLNMIPTIIDSDLDAARAVHRRTMGTYVVLPNYRNYWKEAGWEAEMVAIEAAISAGERDHKALMTDAWIDDVTASGPPERIAEIFEESYDAGVTPIAVMSSTTGGQVKAVQELFSVYD